MRIEILFLANPALKVPISRRPSAYIHTLAGENRSLVQQSLVFARGRAHEWERLRHGKLQDLSHVRVSAPAHNADRYS